MSKKMIYQIASMLMALAMVLGNFVPAQASPAQTTGPTLYWGALVDAKVPSSANLDGVYKTFETRAKKKMSIIHWGQSWVGSDGTWGEFQTTYFQNVRNHGSIPMLNWCSQRLGAGANQPDFQNRDIYNGKYDTYIRRWATAAKNWGHPFFLRFDHEMNGWWYPWGEGKTSSGAIVNGNSTGDYIKAWRHVHDIFVSVGATNVTWVWAPNISPNSSQYPYFSSLYPGNSYVNWTGLSAYNKFNSWLGINPLLTGNTTDWLRNSYNELVNVAPGKPMMLAEWASIEAGDGGTKKAAWIKDALTNQIPLKFPQVKAVVYFNWATGGATYPIQSSTAATNAWAAAVGSTLYSANTFAKLGNTPIAPLSPLSTASTTLGAAEATPETLTDGPSGAPADNMEMDDTPTEDINPQSSFSDVTPDHPAAALIEQLYAAGWIDPCATDPLQFCPDEPVTRAGLAVILERVLHGATYVPPQVEKHASFSDVSTDDPAAAFIEQFAQDGLADACKGRKYCPDAPVTRAELAQFLLRFQYGAGYTPPDVGDDTGFADVPPDHPSAAWIKQFVAEGIATGCGDGNYCPDAPVTRAEFALDLGRILGLP